MTAFMSYLAIATPALILTTVCFTLIPTQQVALRTSVAIVGFFVLRDAMTPAGLWRIGSTESVTWIRFDDGPELWLLAVNSALLALAFWWGIGQGRARIPILATMKASPAKRAGVSIGLGLAGATVIVAPMLAAYTTVPLGTRGGGVAAAALPAILALALAGNALEEVLFRGALQSELEAVTDRWRAALASGTLFAVGHLHLALFLTDASWALIGFVWFEGVVCALVRVRGGLLAATLAHGLAIFALTSGL